MMGGKNRRWVSQVRIWNVRKSDSEDDKVEISQWEVRDKTQMCLTSPMLMRSLIKACKHYGVPKLVQKINEMIR